MRLLAKLLLALLSFFFAFTSGVTATENLLQNPDFEQNSDTGFTNWAKTPSTLTLSVASGSGQARNGNFAARFKSQTNSTKFLYQVVSSPSGSYKLSAWLQLLNINQSGFVRISWYGSSDGSGTEISSVDSPTVTTIGDWQKVEVTSETPSSANSLRTKLVLDPNSSDIYELLFDEVVLEKVDPAPILSFSITLPPEVDTGEEFNLTVSLTGLTINSKYFLKMLGDQKTKLPGELFNFYTWSPSKSTYLAWNASWSDFPSLTADASGTAFIMVKGKFKSDSFIGENKIVVRLRKDGATTNIDSDAAAITVKQPEADPIETDDGKKEPAIPGPFSSSINKTFVNLIEQAEELTTKSSGLNSTQAAGVILGTEAARTPLSLVNPKPKIANGKVNSLTEFPWEIPLVLVGGLFFGSAILTIIIKGGGWAFIRGIFISG